MANLRQADAFEKYVGDAVLLYWGGSPAVTGRQALEAALGIKTALADMAVRHRSRGSRMPTPTSGIGIATGAVCRGRFGPPWAAECTVIGAAVNDAAGLANAARAQTILVSDPVKRGVCARTRWRAGDFEPHPPVQKGSRRLKCWRLIPPGE